MQVIELVRHGPVAGPAALYGHTDIALADPAPECLNWLNTRSYQRVLCSPLQRCQHSARQQAQRLGLPLERVDALMEMNFGDWDGVPFAEQHPFWPQQQRFWQDPLANPPPGGESLPQFRQRVLQAFFQHSSYQPGSQLWLCHAGVIRAIVAEVEQLQDSSRWWQKYDLPYGSVCRLQRLGPDSSWQLLCIGTS